MQFILNPEFTGVLLAFKISFISISLVLFVLLVIVFFKASWFKSKYVEDYIEFFTWRPCGAKKEFKRWKKVTNRLESGRETELKMAVVEADDLIKEVFQKMEYEGDFLDDILEKVDKKVLPSIDKVKEVHDIRNRIVHDSDFQLTAEQARNIIRVYQQALTELEMF